MPEFKTTDMNTLIEEARRISDGHEKLYMHNEDGSRRNPFALGDRYQIQTLNITHEMIIDWLITNPGVGQMGKCAEYFGVTRTWLSILVNSDAFKAKLRDRQDEIWETTVIPLKEKISGVAHRAIEKVGEALEETEDPRYMLDVADKMLHKLGYAPKSTLVPAAPTEINNTQNNYYVSPDLLAAAREKAKKGDLNEGREALGATRAADALPSPEGVPGKHEDLVGEVIPGDAAVYGRAGEEEG